MNFEMFLAITIFAIAYVAILFSKSERAAIALFGAAIVMLLHLVPQEYAFTHAIDFNVIFLLVGMMMIGYITSKTGLFEWIAISLARLAKGHPLAILILTSLATAIISAFIDNVTTIFLMAPVISIICQYLNIDAVPFFIMGIISSNIGGTATLIGDPPNILIGSAAGYSFNTFVVNLSPIILLIQIIAIIMALPFFRKRLKATRMLRIKIMDMDPKDAIHDKSLFKKSVIVLCLVLLGFVFHDRIGAEAATIALLGASLLAISAKIGFEEIMQAVDWNTIFFIIGLFVLVGALEHTRLIELAAKILLRISGGNILPSCIAIIWTAGIISGFAGALPITIAMIPLIRDLIAGIATHTGISHSVIAYPLWWSLALGACLGGNLTPMGTAAGITMLGFAQQDKHPISFRRYFKYSAPIVFVSLVFSSLYIWLRYFSRP